MKEIRVIELFAGVGGFRVGLERANEASDSKFSVVWSNQWEPGTTKQYASEVYEARFGHEGHVNGDISKVLTAEIPDHDLLVGGFPCQDYSVAKTLNQAAGIVGKKGVLWWDIHRILSEKVKRRPKYLLLENVDRLIKSPATRRGRDFAIMLSSLANLGYAVEWRVINAADYGMPQRRRRVFILGYHRTSRIFREAKRSKTPLEWIYENGLFAGAFPIEKPHDLGLRDSLVLDNDIVKITEDFNLKGVESPFCNSGLMIDHEVTSRKVVPAYTGMRRNLGDILLTNGSVPESFYVDELSVPKWKILKGAKNEPRINRTTGFTYNYSEGSMVFPDPLDKPARTIVTGEGGSTPSRFKHVIQTADGRLRRLTPIELERLNGFPDDHTKGPSDVKRAFFMGNALVVDIVEILGRELLARI